MGGPEKGGRSSGVAQQRAGAEGRTRLGEDFIAEVRRLSASFGIGIIRLSVEDPDSSDVLVPARQRDGLDWDTLNKLTMNKDVKELLVRVKNDLQTKEVIKEKYDQVLPREQLFRAARRKRERS